MAADATRQRSEIPSALPAGTRLGEFELRDVLGVGGFGIVYLAFDHALEREVAVKEYMPASLAGRTETMHVSLRSQSDAETFALGLKSFVNEARLLARFDHPSLLKVHRFWEANGTAYMAMPVMRGHTVKDVRQGMSHPPDEAWMRSLMEPLLGAIDKLHSEDVYHRDIAPDNIQIDDHGHPVLLDFGAARRVIGDKSQTLTAILKPSYAPIEQYAEAGSVRQGPWTDLYALGATMHFALLGRPPAPATARAIHDEPSALTVENLPGCSEGFLRIIDWMLAPRPADRPQSVSVVLEALAGRLHAPHRRLPETHTQWDRTAVLPHTVPDITLDNGDATTQVLPTGSPWPAPAGDRVGTAAPSAPAPAAGPATPAPPMHAGAAREMREMPRTSVPQPLLVAPAITLQDTPPAAATRSRLLPLALGAGVVALAAVLAVSFWPRGQGVKPAEPAASAMAEPSPLPALAGPASQPGPAAAAAASEPAPAPARAESTITTVVVPTPSAARPSPKPAAVAPPPVAATVTPPSVQEAAPPKPVPAAAPVEVAAPVAAPVEAPKPAATGPEALCASKGGVLHFICMERECLRSEFSAHPDCRKWRKDAQRD